jgi:DNA-binding LytR/AlgR family response regulator
MENYIYKIVICDDEEIFCRRIYTLLSQFARDQNENLSIRKYTSSSIFLEEINEAADLYFLDVRMPEHSGMELAAIIRAIHPDSTLIFVSSFDDAVFESIQYAPYRFIRKEHLDTEIKEAMASFIKQKNESDFILLLHTTTTDLMIPAKAITYVETAGHYLFFYDTKQHYTVRGKLSDYTDFLSPHAIHQISQSYLVNMRFISSYQTKKIMLYNNMELTISRHYQLSFKKKFLEYKRSLYHANCL